MSEAMLFPPTEREAALGEVRRALTAEMEMLCRATREACECSGDGDTAGGACLGCPKHALTHINGVLDRLTRRRHG